MRKTVLVADDDLAFRTAMADGLRAAGYDVAVAGNGLETIRQVRLAPPHFLLLDLIMPKLDGIRACRVLKRHPQHRNIPVIILTALGPDGLKHLEELEADACVAKRQADVTVAEVLETLERLGSAGPRPLPPADTLQGLAPRRIVSELLAERRHTETLLETLGEGIVEVDEQGQVVFANPAGLEIVGRTEDEILGTPGADLLGPANGAMLREGLRRLRQAENPRPLHLTLSHGHRTVGATLTALGRAGAPAGALLVLSDLTGQTQRTRSLHAVAAVSRHILGTLDLGAVFREIVTRTAELLETERCGLFRAEAVENGYRVRCIQHRGLSDRHARDFTCAAGEGVIGKAVEERRAVATRHLLEDPDLRIPAALRKVALEEGFEAVLAVPILLPDEAFGALTVFRAAGHHFTAEEVELVTSLADAAAIAIVNARLHEDAERRAREATVLAEVGRALSESLDASHVLETIVRGVQRMMGVPFAGIMGLDEGRQELAYLRVVGTTPERMARVRLRVGEGIAGQALALGVPAQSRTLPDNPRLSGRGLAEAEGFRSLLSAPLLARGRPLGVINVFRRDEHEFTPAELRLLARFADQAAVALENARLYGQARDTLDFLQSIAANSADAIVTTDVKGSCTYASPGIQGLFGYRPEEILGQPVAAYYRGGPDEARAVMRRLRQEGRIRSYETAFRAKDGRWVDVSMSVSLLRDRGGAIAGTLGVNRDITERKRAEAALGESEERYRSFFENSIDAVLLTVPDGGILAANPEACRLFGQTEAEICAAGRTGLVDPADPRLPVALAERARTGRFRGELTFRRKDGSTFPGEVSTAIFRDRDGHERTSMAIRDITERKRAEGDLRKFLHAVEQSPSSIVITDTTGRIEYVNPKFTHVTGYAFDEVIGKTPRILKSGETAPEEYVRLWEAITAGREWRGEFHNRKKDGTLFWESASISPITTGEGVITHFVAVKEDITERKRAQEQLRQSEKLATMGELLAGVAHELNNPLSIVMGQATLLGMTAPEGPTADRAKRIIEAAERCARIVKNFLALARQRPPERRKVWLNQIVQEAVELLGYQLRVENIGVELDLAPNLPVLWADAHQLHQVLVNLVTNAHHAMRSTPPPRRLAITTRFDPARQRVAVDVADTGPGIPSEFQARIFEPFFTTKPPGQGTGLGLSLCQGIIEGHGGVMGVEVRPGWGAVIRVELPVEGPPAATGSNEAGGGCDHIQGKAILVVDDEPLITELLAEILVRDGHTVAAAANGAEGLQKLQERAFDLILSDIKMPDLDGPGMYREVSRRHPELGARFIFLTGDRLSPETREFLEQTKAPNLSKPFSLDDVRRVILQALAPE